MDIARQCHSLRLTVSVFIPCGTAGQVDRSTRQCRSSAGSQEHRGFRNMLHQRQPAQHGIVNQPLQGSNDSLTAFLYSVYCMELS
ncbi:hypothetical protein [Taibaiella helva]|uniref:hypothetical protein n=1 Tax=Taibaiella helva TaxID=2301235 RepID=UPI0013001FBE|nr:hypothetical protein [Taibaiella helva]